MDRKKSPEQNRLLNWHFRRNNHNRDTLTKINKEYLGNINKPKIIYNNNNDDDDDDNNNNNNNNDNSNNSNNDNNNFIYSRIKNIYSNKPEKRREMIN